MIKRMVQVLGLILIMGILLCLGYTQQAEAKPIEVVESEEIRTVPLPVVIIVPMLYTCLESEEEVEIDEAELDLLAHLIFAEAGSDWCSDILQQYTGSVVLNRMASDYYPDTMYEVIYQKGQYSTAWNGMLEYEYNDRAYECAKFLLENGSVLPENVVFQAEFKQGDGIYEEIELTRGRKMYFCYKEKK